MQPTSDARLVHSVAPLNVEPTLERLRASFFTSRADFYVRCHGDIPRLDPETHRLRVDGQVRTPLDLSMAELRATFATRTVGAALQCAGNRRADLAAVRPVSGDLWSGGAIGNATWTGVALADVLRAAGAEPDRNLHIAFAACDMVEMPDEGRFRYGASIRMSKAMADEVVLAFAMNGEPLTAEHGYPLRVLVPGFAGVRSVKWLEAITVQDQPSDNHMQQRDYKLLPPDVTAETVDWGRGIEINDMPLNTIICEPRRGTALPAGPTTVRGVAIAGGRIITRVDVSADGGARWTQADLAPCADSRWCWTFWEAEIDVAPSRTEIVARAWDEAGQTQPSRSADLWNYKGYLSAAWHRVQVHVA